MATTEIYTYCHSRPLHDALPISCLSVLMIAMKVSFACARGRSAAARFKFPGGEGRVDARHRPMRGLEIQYGVEVRAFSRVERLLGVADGASRPIGEGPRHRFARSRESVRTAEHTSELQPLMRIP